MARNLTRISKNKMLDNFLLAIAAGSGFVEAGKKAGFGDVEATVAREVHNPEFLPAMSNVIRHRLGGRMAVQAMRVAEEFLNDKNTSARIRWDVAKTILAAGAGFIPPKARESEAPPQDISQMSAQELLEFSERVNLAMAAKADAAKLIQHEPQAFEDLD